MNRYEPWTEEELRPGFDFEEAAAADTLQTQFAKTLDVPPSPMGLTHAAPPSWTTLVYTPEFAVPVDWELVLQPASLPSGGVLQFRVTFTLGAASFTKKPVTLTSTMAMRYHVTGRRVQVDISNTATSGPAITMTAGVGRSVVDSPRDWYMAWWSSTGVNISTALDTGPGVLMAYQALMTAMTGDAQAYLVFLDAPATGPTASQTALWATPAFTAAPQWASFADTDDARLVYQNGLWAALSSTPNVYTASTGTGAVTLSTKVGC